MLPPSLQGGIYGDPEEAYPSTRYEPSAKNLTEPPTTEAPINPQAQQTTAQKGITP
ncbi:hypothetical protein GCM10007392_39710 [Saccharospirillum salsuginis]|uniref:Uncharacterized protein n=1 Tax=Saccharospirillum salsuginis TaxID=418750 RepID=A0A918NHH7_9GAMM|nr:hypothetical protein GCM10007392_39710 [Saccharospirillum salsuginis]